MVKRMTVAFAHVSDTAPIVPPTLHCACVRVADGDDAAEVFLKSRAHHIFAEASVAW